MKNKLKPLIAFLILILFSFNSFAEHELMTWGEIDEEHLKMTEYEADPDASVLFLGDYAEVFGENVDFNNYTAYKYVIRVKILTEEGLKKYASHKIGYYQSSNEQIKYIEAQSFTLQGDGSVKTVVLDKDDIKTERVSDNFSFKVFSIPGAQVGSVIEYRFKKWTELSITIDPFWFQGSEPKLWSEIRFHPPKYTAYVTIPTGILIKRMVEAKSHITLGQPNSNGQTYRYYMEDIPAFRSEPYTKNMSDYYSKVEFQLHSYASGTGFTNSLFHTWEELIEDLLDDDDLGRHMKGSNKLLKEARPVYENIADPEGKMIAIYNHIQTVIEWNHKRGMFSLDRLNEVYEKRTGSGAQMNLLLALLLKDAGIETDLMLVSTRQHGLVVKNYPYLHRFNLLICRAQIGGKHYILDAKNKYRPHEIVPAELINTSALVLDKSKVEWVNIKASTAMTETINAHIKWNENAEVMAMVMEKNEGYGALKEQIDLDGVGEKEYLKNRIKEWTDGEIKQHKVKHKTEPNSLIVQYEVDSDKFVTGDGTRLYFNTFVATGYKENHFKLEERLFPVDFNYPIKETNRFNIEIPKGYKAEEVPETAAFAMEGKAASFHITYSQQPNQIQVVSTLKINEISLSPVQYQALKIFFDRIVEKHTELIVFSKEE